MIFKDLKETDHFRVPLSDIPMRGQVRLRQRKALYLVVAGSSPPIGVPAMELLSGFPPAPKKNASAMLHAASSIQVVELCVAMFRRCMRKLTAILVKCATGMSSRLSFICEN